jgi:hypothetical protein
MEAVRNNVNVTLNRCAGREHQLQIVIESDDKSFRRNFEFVTAKHQRSIPVPIIQRALLS